MSEQPLSRILGPLTHPWKCQITSFSWTAPGDGAEEFLDIVLEEPADGIYRPVREDGRLGGNTVSHHLRFFSPSQVSIDGTNLPLFQCADLCILDVSSWGWERISVQVKGCGADGTP